MNFVQIFNGMEAFLLLIRKKKFKQVQLIRLKQFNIIIKQDYCRNNSRCKEIKKTPESRILSRGLNNRKVHKVLENKILYKNKFI